MTKKTHNYIESYELAHTDLPLTVFLVRHGQPDRKHDGGEERGPGLTALGHRQADRLAKRLEDEQFDHIYVSDLKRAQETAHPIIAGHKKAPVTVESDLREVASDHFLPDEQARRSPAQIVHERDSISRFVNKLRHAHEPGQKVLVVCHGNIIRTIMPVLGGRNPKESVLMDLYHTSLSLVEVWRSGEAVVKLANCVRHLLPRQVT